MTVADPYPVLDVPLPGTWVVLDLTEAGRLMSDIDAVASSVGPAGAAKHEHLRNALIDGATDAIGMEACMWALCLEIAPGVRVPMSLAVCWPRTPLTFTEDMPTHVTASMLEALADTGHEPHDADAAIVRPSSAVVRRVEEVVRDVDGDPFPFLDVDHWVLVAGAQHPARVFVTVPADDSAPDLLAMLDEMIGSIEWHEPN